ncbi:MAG: single-stranded-DNA-specific exonuclease RecJ [Anaerolineales bacterium]
MNAPLKRWLLPPRITPEAEQALRGFPPVLRQILFNRGYADPESARRFLEARPQGTTDPFGLRGIPQAIARLRDALQNEELIAIYGDYDADGVTATALLTAFLRELGANVRPYIPNRFDEGYGINTDALDTLKNEGVQLVVSVDCGIRSLHEAKHARTIGLDLIITDHHHPGAELPDALAVINPKQAGDTYPEKDLAGVGLAYKLACALESSLTGSHPRADRYLDLVALGTVADLAPLVSENRTLVRQGLLLLRQPERQGVASLMSVAGVKAQSVSATDIGFMLGPRLNAAGRLDTALDALHLLTTDNLMEAGRLAQKLQVQNQERQALTREIQQRAEQIALADDPEAFLLFAAHPDFNPGVVGLAASRLTEQFYRPAIVAHQSDEGFTRGSCRSIGEFHITNALDQCADLLEHHGGHAAAAGFTVSNQNLDAFVTRMKAIARAELSGLDLRPVLTADMELPLQALTGELLEHLSWLQPTGYGNREAVFVTRGAEVVRSRTVGGDNSHLKLTVRQNNLYFDAIGFRLGHWHNHLPPKVDLMYTFEVNEYQGRQSLQLNLRDVRA